MTSNLDWQPMALEVGSRLGHYDVTALIGEGGMGQVYQATDTKLDREVALKVLPQAFTDAPDRLARFEREAKVLASLNHPNIGHIYGLEEAEGQKALVLELVEGPTLADRIAQGPIPLDEALPIARQIAEALEAAHEQGVIHRDLKPANVKVRPDGMVKVLDFGLAKAFEPEAGSVSASMSPTISLTAAATQMGMVIGTAAYMAPEQASGKVVDKRADVWAFGVVLYEMLTGTRPFTGDDVSKTLARVIDREPDWSTLPTEMPPVLGTFLRGCLEKNPKQRVHDVADERLAMEGTFETTVSGPREPTVAPELQVWQRPIPLALTGLALLAIGGFAVWIFKPPPQQPVTRLAISVPPSVPVSLDPVDTEVALSPDGTRVVYRGGQDATGQLYVRGIDQLEAIPLRGSEGAESQFLSPDGSWVAFQAGPDGPLLKVSILGGPPVTITELQDNLRGASWGADDVIIFGTASPAGLMRVSGAGGDPEAITTPENTTHKWPDILPDGAGVLFTIDQGPEMGNEDIALLDLDTGEHRVITPGGSHAKYSPTGHIVYGVDRTLRAVAFDLDTLNVTGDPVPVVEDVLMKSGGAVSFDLSDTGSLVYVSEGAAGASEARTLIWVDRDGREEELTAPPAAYESPRVSPDGRYVAVEVRDTANFDVMVYDLERDTPTRLTFDPANDAFPLWSPDGRRVLFSSDRDGVLNIYSKAADGTGPAERLTTSDSLQSATSWSGDGRSLVISETTDISVLSPGTESVTEGLIETEFVETYPEVSPDGRWIAYMSNESGQFEVYVRPFPNVDDGRWQISRDGGVSPVWAPDGQELFFRSPGTGALDMMVAPVGTEPTFSPGNPEVLFAAPYRGPATNRARPWDVAPDGRFLMLRERDTSSPDEEPTQVVLVQNWFEELKRLVSLN